MVQKTTNIQIKNLDNKAQDKQRICIYYTEAKYQLKNYTLCYYILNTNFSVLSNKKILTLSGLVHY